MTWLLTGQSLFIDANVDTLGFIDLCPVLIVIQIQKSVLEQILREISKRRGQERKMEKV